jgi:predicted membrane metal-binding protein
MSLSFQLSFLSVFGIISFSPTLNKLFNKIKIPKSLASVFSISVCTNLAILPVCANAFTKVSLLGIFTNFFVIPLFTVNYILAFFIVLLSFIFTGLGKLLVLPNLFLHLIKFIAELSTKVDGLVFKTFQNSYIILFLFCSAILLLHYLMSKKLVKFSIILPLIMLSVVQFSVANIEYKAIDNTLIFTHQYKSNIVFYIKDNEVTMIGSNIDCDSLLYAMKNLKIRDIDNLVAYDMQLNNMKNLKEIIDEFDVENLYIPNKFEYSEISSTFNNEIFYKNNIEI